MVNVVNKQQSHIPPVNPVEATNTVNMLLLSQTVKSLFLLI